MALSEEDQAEVHALIVLIVEAIRLSGMKQYADWTENGIANIVWESR